MGGKERRLQSQLHHGGVTGPRAPLHQRALLRVMEETELQTRVYQETGLTASSGKKQNSICVCSVLPSLLNLEQGGWVPGRDRCWKGESAENEGMGSHRDGERGVQERVWLKQVGI